ncbi:hypothetical protein MPDQ_004776 [Monascus purpureus]|uniref:Uncharacterized protein n=1 Tax=Monascus purpureus TaxID=5098 RepID=A0A507R1N4_MONPU|nr:hypothetical protein MPDQ_004776 [Monascus purpureus]BDD62877.1 hypothetical protein MAP00_007831 [Monascus purpureus]
MSSSTPVTFKPALILHGGAGSIQRSTLPPELWAQYHASLRSYLRSTHEKLKNGASALDAVVHAVSLMEDDELFNCGRGSVFTSAGTIEMEASVMVTTVQDMENGETAGGADGSTPTPFKRGAGVIGVKNVRHPIQLARECLLRTGYDESGNPNGDGGNMHSQLAAPFVEELARDWKLEFMPDEWFWTKKRWEEHLRGLRGEKESVTMSQGTVGCVCLDQWGNLAVATSTGGLTNKAPGRIGDTPTFGAGFWAETWEEDVVGPRRVGDMEYRRRSEEDAAAGSLGSAVRDLVRDARSLLADCLPASLRDEPPAYEYASYPLESEKQPLVSPPPSSRVAKRRRAIAVSGTGNGDSFLRVAAARTASAMLRFSSPSASPRTLAEAVTAVAGPNGELQRSAGNRWGITGEGAGGMIGIEAEIDVYDNVSHSFVGRKNLRRGKVVFDFNSGGMFRAWVEEGDNGEDIERVMVFRGEYR